MAPLEAQHAVHLSSQLRPQDVLHVGLREAGIRGVPWERGPGGRVRHRVRTVSPPARQLLNARRWGLERWSQARGGARVKVRETKGPREGPSGGGCLSPWGGS